MARRLPRLSFTGFFLALAAAGLVAGCGAREGAGTKAVELPGTGSLAVEARLEEVPGPFPANDLYDYVFIMKYRVVKVLRGHYDDSILLVGHYNPRLSRSEIEGTMDSLVDGTLTSFQPGDVHQLVLREMDSVWTQAVEDGYFRDARKRYFARWVSK
jgi:hypothetical protein